MAPKLTTLWETLSHKVMSVVLVDDGAVFAVIDEIGRARHLWHPKVREMWNGVMQCLDEDVPPSVETVALRCGANPGYIQTVANQWTDEDSRRLLYNASEMKKLGGFIEFRGIADRMLDVEDPNNLIAAVETAEYELDSLLVETIDRAGDVKTVDEVAWETVEKGISTIPTGLGWYDDTTGGLWVGMNHWIVAPYKSGKSVCMRNMVISALDDGYAVDVFCAEGSRKLFALDCQAMIATRKLVRAGYTKISNHKLSGLYIMRAWNNREYMLTDDEVEAIKQARDTWRNYNLRIYDTKDGITDLAVLRSKIKQDKLNHGIVGAYADYSQLFGSGETLFERQSTTALRVQEMAAKENVAFVMLAQQNESTIRSGMGHSPGVKGGGDAAAAADFLLIPSFDKELPYTLNIDLKLSRHTATMSGSHRVSPASGLILGELYTGDEDDIEF